MLLSNTVKAGLWMLGAVFALIMMAVAGREVSHEFDTFEIMMYRSFVGIFIVLLVGGFAGSLSSISKKRFGLHSLRNICHFTGQNLWFYALTVIPLAQLFALEFSTPIWVAIMTPFFLGERLTTTRIFTILLGFFGIIIVAQPGTMTIGLGLISAALCAIFFAGAFISTKLLARKESVTSILFWLTFMQFIFGVACVFYDGEVTLPSFHSLPLLIVIGCSGLLAHYCITSAFKLASILFVSPIDFLRLPLIAIIGAIFYHEAINSWVIIGAIIVFGSNFLSIWLESRNKTISLTK